MVCACTTYLLVFPNASIAQTQQPALLAGHAVLPAASFINAPEDAPEALKFSGKFTIESSRNDANKPLNANEAPFSGQPI